MTLYYTHGLVVNGRRLSRFELAVERARCVSRVARHWSDRGWMLRCNRWGQRATVLA